MELRCEREIREVPSDVIRKFIVDRIIPYNRTNLDCYLEYYNLEYWDEWEVFLAAKGMCFLDIFWIRKDKSESYKNHIRFTNSVRDDLLTEEYFIKKKKIFSCSATTLGRVVRNDVSIFKH